VPPMKTFTLQAIRHASTKRPPGYLEDVLSHGTVEGDKVTLSDEAYAALCSKYRGPKAAKPSPPKVESHGPGTELKSLMKKVGIVSSPTCSCNARARKMDEMGIEWCESEDGMKTILGWLREESEKRGLPFVEFGAKVLVKRAIYNARRKGH